LRKNLLIPPLFVLLAILFSWPVLENLNYWGIQDWDWFLTQAGLTRESILIYGQLPLWNPYWKGGMPLLAHPESNILSPAFLVQLFAGEVIAAKINIVLHYFIGLIGMYVLSRWFRLDRIAAILAAVVFMLSSIYALALTVGMEWGYGIAFMPWAFYCFLRGREKFVWAIAASLVLAMMWFGGGVYPFTITFLLLGTYTLAAVCCREMQLKKGIILLAAVAVCTFLLGAVKFFPAVEFSLQYTRHSNLYAGMSIQSLFYGLFGRDQTLAAILGKSSEHGLWHGFSQGMDETGMYVGILSFLLFLIGMITRARRCLPLLVCFIVFLWLSLGNRAEPLSLWEALKNIPPYNIMRSVERFRIVVVMVLALFAGFGLNQLQGRLADWFPGKNWPSLVVNGVVLLVLCDLFLVNGPILKDAFSIPPIETPAREEFRQIGGLPEYDRNGFRYDGVHDLYTTFGGAYPAWLANLGSVYAYVSVPIPENAIIVPDKRYQGEVFLEETGGSANYRFWTPNRLIVDVHAKNEGWLVVNQNYFPGWRAGKLPVESRRGLLSVKVDPQISTVEFVYRPVSFIVGAALSMLTLIVLVFWCWRSVCKKCKVTA